MEIPYILKLGKGLKNKHSRLPAWCKYPLHFAKEKTLFELPQTQVFSQQLNHKPFFVDLVQLRATQPLYIPFDILDRQLYLHFMLKGHLLYTTGNYRPIIQTQPSSFQMSYYDVGSYYAYVPKGVHIILVISILPEWIEGMSGDYPNVKHILERFKAGNKAFETMYQCRINRKIHRWLYKIYSYSQANIGAIDGNLRKYISYLLEYYDNATADQNADLAYKIKEYIQEHYCENALNIKFLADHFFVSERTLLNIFKRHYHMAVQECITGLRMAKAIDMIEIQGLPIKDVYMEVGYTNERPFRAALERFRKGKS